ncbi:MAG: hypothetical protein JWN86_3883 [Planctomycetota bacterium]|nr:hypothetical protein [Planctomycetota bacterium]
MNFILRVSVLKSRLWRALVLIAALGMTGCGSNVKVTGTVSRSGLPVDAVKGMQLEVGFHPLAKAEVDGKTPTGPDLYAANVASDGSFDVPGIDGEGIPPGKYRVSVVLRAGRDRSQAKKKGKNGDPDKDLLNGAFAPENSPIVREITSSQPLRIDLDQPSP